MIVCLVLVSLTHRGTALEQTRARSIDTIHVAFSSEARPLIYREISGRSLVYGEGEDVHQVPLIPPALSKNSTAQPKSPRPDASL